MAEDEKKVEEPGAKAAPMTSEEFSAALEELTARAKAAGLRPLQVMFSLYAKQGMTVVENLLSAFEEGSPKKPPPKKEG
jgi:hypothetical protein